MKYCKEDKKEKEDNIDHLLPLTPTEASKRYPELSVDLVRCAIRAGQPWGICYGKNNNMVLLYPARYEAWRAGEDLKGKRETEEE